MQAESIVAEIRVNKLAANIVSGLLAVVLCAAGVLGSYLLPHHVPVSLWHAIVVLAALAVLMPAHEALHALGLIWFAKVSWRDIKFGVMWHALMPYCHCRVPITLRAYRRMALLPFWVTSAATVIPLILYPTEMLGLLAGATVSACVGDIWLVCRVRRFTNDQLLVQDSATEIGCDVHLDSPNTARFS